MSETFERYKADFQDLAASITRKTALIGTLSGAERSAKARFLLCRSYPLGALALPHVAGLPRSCTGFPFRDVNFRPMYALQSGSVHSSSSREPCSLIVGGSHFPSGSRGAGRD